MLKSLLARNDQLSSTENQLKHLNSYSAPIEGLPKFAKKLHESGILEYRPNKLEIFQINLGKMCNQTCKHCHVDAGPDRREIMTRETMTEILNHLRRSTAHTVDLTGGAPEMNPHFRWFVEELRKVEKEIIVRCNLTIIRANKTYYDLPEFYKQHGVHVVSSLPYYDQSKTDRQRGDGVFRKSIEALKSLNEIGYGISGTGLKLDLVYNPAGAFLPGPQEALERDFRTELKKLFDIEFSNLFAITNMPISRYLEYLVESGNFEEYMQKLVEAFNPQAALSAMCRNTISVSWDGEIFDCDFNQMLNMPVRTLRRAHISDYDESAFMNRSIATNQHCFGCTAGSGSSCGGATA